jgi:hypothetical protein
MTLGQFLLVIVVHSLHDDCVEVAATLAVEFAKFVAHI